jgi:YD repeat-containing protein
VKKRLLTLFILVTVFTTPAIHAQQGGTTRYVYDDTGRLIAVISPTGEANVYEYDAAGNFTTIRHLTSDDLAVFAFTPRAGVPGDLISFIGIGFGGGVSSVSFNGTTARIVSVTASTIVAEVPQGATTGPVMIVTPSGTVATSKPFIIQGVRVSPLTAKVLPGAQIQFTVTVSVGNEDPIVVWSVNGITGGNSAVGTITSDGLFTAGQPTASALVRATSVAIPTLFGEAEVRVINPEDVVSVLAPGVSVLRPVAGEVIATAGSSVSVQRASSEPLTSAAVSVHHPAPGTFTSVAIAGVSVLRPPLGNVTSAAVSVLHPAPNTLTSVAIAGASVQRSELGQQQSEPVSVTNGPNISSASPGTLSRNTMVTLTINGPNLSGATTIRFIDANGAIDSSVVASNLNASADGTSLTATVTVSSGAALGVRVIVVSTATSRSLPANVGSNTIQIVQ